MEPAGHIDTQPWMTAPGTRAVIDALGAEGAVVRIVGGAVRDAVIGFADSDTEIDIATPDGPGTVTRLLEAAGLRAVPTGIKHGTVTVVAAHRPFEITTLRRDVETDGRHATVAFIDDWAADAARRDFTMNALYCDPGGTLYDPVGGLADLKAGRVRFIGHGPTRIDEDALRVLRFFRFHARYGSGAPDSDAVAACRAKAAAVATLSGERVGGEMLKLLAVPTPCEALEQMIETGVMAHVLPGVRRIDGLAALCQAEAGAPDGLRRLAMLLRPGGNALAAAQRLRLSNDQRDRLMAMVEPGAAVDGGLDPLAQRRVLYRIGAAPFIDLVYLAWADAAFHEQRDAKAMAAPYDAMIATARNWPSPALPVKGADVIALGVAPGPEVGQLLTAVEDWWIAGDFKADRDETLAKLKELTAAIDN
ncbi:MAG: CCA tRNA nucleotidyltransferase [Alphaproteobacteria bacterium]|jgi:poly(A) polymerase